MYLSFLGKCPCFFSRSHRECRTGGPMLQKVCRFATGGMVGHVEPVKDLGENWSPVKPGFHPKTVYGCLHSN